MTDSITESSLHSKTMTFFLALDDVGMVNTLTLSPVLPSASLAVSAPSPTDGKTARAQAMQINYHILFARSYNTHKV
jgi:hypothetical protein